MQRGIPLSAQRIIFATMPRQLTLIFLLLPLVMTAQQSTNARVNARAELSRTEITIGDQIWLEVNLSVPPDNKVAPLPEGYINGLPGVETIEAKAMNTVAETPELLLQQRFLVTSFDSGYVSIPPLPYAYQRPDGTVDTAFTNDLLLQVRTLPIGEDDELRPIKPIIEEPVNIYDLWPLFLVALLGLIALVTYRNFKASKRVVPPPPPPPADLKALNELKELEQKGLWEKGETKAYYSELTRIFREYLTARFNVPALEMTSRQINKELGLKTKLSADQRGEIKQLLQLSDLVKFAKATPAAELHVAGLERVRTFVRNTGPETEAPEPATIIAPAESAGAAATPPIVPVTTAQKEEE